MTFGVVLCDPADDAVRRAIAAPLLAYNAALAGPSGHRALALRLLDASGEPVGGLWGSTGHGWLYTQMLFVPEALRGCGAGARLMQGAHAEAVVRGCGHAWVDTQFGARVFYERQGYRVFAELADYPPGFARTFLSRAIP